jgi:hypothetical protein
VIRTPGAMGEGFADAVSTILGARLLPGTT